jgi:hypothetical protein
MSAFRRTAPMKAKPNREVAQRRTTITPCLGQGAAGRVVR